MTNRQSLEHTVKRRPTDVAFHLAASGRELTYREFDRTANAVGNALRELGVRTGDRVCLILPNDLAFPVTLYGSYKSGAVPVALNYRLATADLAYVFDQVNAQAVVYDTSLDVPTSAAIERAACEPISITAAEDGTADHHVEALVDSGSTDPPPERLASPSDPESIIYTSGTTGKPKGVVHSVANARERVTTSIIESETRSDSVWLAMLPWFHGSGLDTVLNASIMMGSTVVVEPDYANPATTLPLVESLEVTSVMSVPTVTDRCANFDDLDSYDLSSVDVWRLTGEVLSAERARTFTERLTPNLYNSYGSSETGVNTILRPEEIIEYAGSAGRPAVGTEFRIVAYEPGRTADPSETVPVGEPGEVILKTDQLFREYIEAPEETLAKRQDGWYYTHDVGVLDENGILTITGRTDEMVLSGGELVSVVGVEKVLESHPDVVAAVVVGVDDEEWGTRLKAFVSTSAELSAADLDRFCREHDGLAGYKRPRSYEFVDEIERSEIGKKRRTPYENAGE